MNAVVKIRGLSTDAARGLYDVFIPTPSLGCETLVSYENDKLRVRAVEINFEKCVMSPKN